MFGATGRGGARRGRALRHRRRRGDRRVAPPGRRRGRHARRSRPHRRERSRVDCVVRVRGHDARGLRRAAGVARSGRRAGATPNSWSATCACSGARCDPLLVGARRVAASTSRCSRGRRRTGCTSGRARSRRRSERRATGTTTSTSCRRTRCSQLAARHGFGWTILRPQVVYGKSLASPMNLLRFGDRRVHGTLEREGAGRRAGTRWWTSSARSGRRATLAGCLAWAAIGRRRATRSSTSPTATCSTGTTSGRRSPRRSGWRSASRRRSFSRRPCRRGPMSGRRWPTATTWVRRGDGRLRRRLVAVRGLLFAGYERRTLPALLSTVKLRQAGSASASTPRTCSASGSPSSGAPPAAVRINGARPVSRAWLPDSVRR